VIILRLRHNLSPFRPDNRHIQHRLLARGFRHDEAVGIIYTLQAVLVSLALLTRYQSDLSVAVLTLVYVLAVFGVLLACESKGWRFRGQPQATNEVPADSAERMERRNLALRRWQQLPKISADCVNAGVALFLLLGTILVYDPSRDISAISLGIAGLMLFAHLFLHPWTALFTRIGIYVLCLFVVYLMIPLTQTSVWWEWSVNLYLIALSCVLALAIRLTRRENFQMTPLDVLVLFFIVVVANINLEILPQYQAGSFVLRVVVLLYASEFILNAEQVSYRLLRFSGFVGLAILGLRGLF